MAFSYDGEYGWPIVESPVKHAHAPAFIAAMQLHEEHGWEYLGTVHEDEQELAP